MGWSESRFKERVRERAAERGLPLYRFVEEIGLPSNFFTYAGKTKIELIERVSRQLGWSMAEALDYSTPINVELSALAFDGADKLIAQLPIWARSRDNQVQAHATIYDLLAARRDEGRLPADEAERRAVMQDYVNMLVRAWKDRPEPHRAAPATLEGTLARLKGRNTVLPERG